MRPSLKGALNVLNTQVENSVSIVINYSTEFSVKNKSGWSCHETLKTIFGPKKTKSTVPSLWKMSLSLAKHFRACLELYESFGT